MSTKLATAWFNRGLEAQALASEAKTAAERQKHGRAAVDALMVAASLGDRDAFLQLGAYYRDGEFGIIPVQPDIAEHWFRLGAAAGDATAMLALGILVKELGRRSEGRRWLRKALAHGDGGAACHLGREVEAKSPSRALRWYLKGAALGDPVAAYFAGEALEARGTRADLGRAAKMYERAARKGFPDAGSALERVRRHLRDEGLD